MNNKTRKGLITLLLILFVATLLAAYIDAL
jgi:hypothetical protein